MAGSGVALVLNTRLASGNSSICAYYIDYALTITTHAGRFQLCIIAKLTISELVLPLVLISTDCYGVFGWEGG